MLKALSGYAAAGELCELNLHCQGRDSRGFDSQPDMQVSLQNPSLHLCFGTYLAPWILTKESSWAIAIA